MDAAASNEILHDLSHRASVRRRCRLRDLRPQQPSLDGQRNAPAHDTCPSNCCGSRGRDAGFTSRIEISLTHRSRRQFRLARRPRTSLPSHPGSSLSSLREQQTPGWGYPVLSAPAAQTLRLPLRQQRPVARRNQGRPAVARFIPAARLLLLESPAIWRTAELGTIQQPFTCSFLRRIRPPWCARVLTAMGWQPSFRSWRRPPLQAVSCVCS